MAGKFELYKDKAGKFRFRLKASNGQVIATGEAYETKASAMKGIESVRKNASDAALEIARVMLQKSPFGLRMTKEVLNQSIDAQSLEAALFMENRTQTLAVMSGDFREGARAFTEKRKPNYEVEA